MYSKLSTAAAILAAASQANALGSAIIKNQCSKNVYLWTVSQFAGEMKTLAPGATFSESYLINPDGGGISIKLATEPDQAGPITQYEYTIAGNLWYDISNINGFPFSDSGLTLTPSTGSCRSMVCPAGVTLCSGVYNQPDDNEATAACDSSADTTLVLCSGEKQNTPASGSSGSSSSSDTSSSNQAPPPAPSSSTSSPPPPPPSSTYVAPPSSTHKDTPSPSPTSAPIIPVFEGNVPANVITTFVTKIVTVYEKRDAAPSPAPEPEAAELKHVHKRAAHRHHFNRRAGDSN